MKFLLRCTLVAVATVSGLVWLNPAHAVPSVTPDLQAIESCSPSTPCNGKFTIINNSSGDNSVYVYGFSVQNQTALSVGTTQPGWSAGFGCVIFIGSTCDRAMVYSNDEGSSTAPSDLANDIGPGQISDLFTFSALAPGSIVAYLIILSGTLQLGQIVASTTDVVPEPTAITVLMSGLVGILVLRGRRRL